MRKYRETILRTPGPTPVPRPVEQAMNRPLVGHRSEQFFTIFYETTQRLKPIFGTKQDVFTITGSGTSALEMACVNVVSPGDEVIVVVTGAFGDRFAAICERYGALTHRLEVPWGEACVPEKLEQFLKKHPGVRAVFLTYCETSTGVLNPVEKLSRVVRETSEALVIVDGVSCLGAVQAKMDEWGIDVLVTGSQKALMLPPGLAFISVSERAFSIIEKNEKRAFYLSLPEYRDQYLRRTTPFTPAVSLIFGLKKALDLIEEEGLEEVAARHELLQRMTREGLRALRLPLFVRDEHASPTVTAVRGTAELDPDELRKMINYEHGITLAGGQKKLKGRIFRIGHMGDCFPRDIIAVLTALEWTLFEKGAIAKLGAGVSRAMEVYKEYVSHSR